LLLRARARARENTGRRRTQQPVRASATTINITIVTVRVHTRRSERRCLAPRRRPHRRPLRSSAENVVLRYGTQRRPWWGFNYISASSSSSSSSFSSIRSGRAYRTRSSIPTLPFPFRPYRNSLLTRRAGGNRSRRTVFGFLASRTLTTVPFCYCRRFSVATTLHS